MMIDRSKDVVADLGLPDAVDAPNNTEIFADPEFRAEYYARRGKGIVGGGIANRRLQEVGRVSAEESARSAIVAEPEIAPKGNVNPSPRSRQGSGQ